MRAKKFFEIIAAMICVAVMGGTAWAGDYVKGDFKVTTNNPESSLTYTSGGQTYYIQGWDLPQYKYTTNGQLMITQNGDYTISMNKLGSTTDRIKIKEGLNDVKLTINGLNIAPNKPDGYMNHYGGGRPFDMKGATVELTVQGNNTFRAPSFSTALFCPENSNLTIKGTGTLNIEIVTSDFAVAGIGGEGKPRDGYSKETYGSTVTGRHDQLARVRDWPNDPDSRCGNITFNGTATTPVVNVTLQIGEFQSWPGGEMIYNQYGVLQEGIVNPPIAQFDRDDQFWPEDTVYLTFSGDSPHHTTVGIGGAYAGNITINGGKITVKTSVLSTAIGSVNRQFGKVLITGGTVYADSGWAKEPSAFTDLVGTTSIGPAIGWVEYGNSLPGEMEIEITGGDVTAKAGYGAAGIGGGVDSTGGTIKISGGRVVAEGGRNGAGIGSGIGQSVQGNTTDKGKIIITGGNVTATGGLNSAGIGGGGNNLGQKVTSGHSGQIIIAGTATVTATGGPNAPAIGSGGSGTGNPYGYAAHVQSIIIATTGTVTTIKGSNAPTNIGTGLLSGNPNIGERYANATIVDLSGTKIDGTADLMPNLISINSNGDIEVKGNVDLTTAGGFTSEQQEQIANAIAAYLNNPANSGKKIVSASGSTDTKLKVSSTVLAKVKDAASGSGIEVNGVTATRYSVTVNPSNGGRVSGSQSNILSGATITITATPNEGYKFDGWYDGAKLISDNAVYNFQVTSSLTLVARFSLLPKDQGGSTNTPGSNTPGTNTPDTNTPGTTPVLPPVDETQEKYDPEKMSTQEKLDNLQQTVGSAEPEISGALDTGASGGSGVNIVVSGGDGEIKSVASDKGTGGAASFQAGQNIVQEIYLLKPGADGKPAFNETDSLNGTKVTVEVGYQETVLMAFDHTITGGHMSIKIPTNDVIMKLSEHLASTSSMRGATMTYDLWMRISDESKKINTTLPLTISFEDKSTGSVPGGGGTNSDSGSGGGGGCTTGVGLAAAAAALLARRRR